jgi:hypothetical protein
MSASVSLLGGLARDVRAVGRRARLAPQPFEITLHPHVDEAHGQDADENQDLGEREDPLPACHPVLEDRHHRIDEGDLDVEDHEHERDQVEADVEVDPGVAARRLTELVGAQLRRRRVRRTQQAPEDVEHQGTEQQPQPHENQHVGKVEPHRKGQQGNLAGAQGLGQTGSARLSALRRVPRYRLDPRPGG